MVRRVLFYGHSMMESTVAQAAYNGTPVTPGFIYRNDGVNQANWDAGPTPGVSILPRLMARAVAQAAAMGIVIDDGWFARRATSGLFLSASADDHVGGLLQDADVLGGSVDAIVIWLGANDSNNADEEAIYSSYAGLERQVLCFRRAHPEAPIWLLGEKTTQPGTYPQLEAVNTCKRRIAGTYPYVRFIDISASSIGMADGIHPDAAAYEIIADLIADAWRGP